MRRLIIAALLLPLPAFADTPAAPAPMPPAQRATEDMVLQLVQIWQKHEIEKEQLKDALRDAQQNTALQTKAVQEKDTDLQKEQAKSKDLEALTIQLQGKLRQKPIEGIKPPAQ